MITWLLQKFCYRPYIISFQHLHHGCSFLDHWVALTVYARSPEEVLPLALQFLADHGLPQITAQDRWAGGIYPCQGIRLLPKVELREYRYQGKLIALPRPVDYN